MSSHLFYVEWPSVLRLRRQDIAAGCRNCTGRPYEGVPLTTAAPACRVSCDDGCRCSGCDSARLIWAQRDSLLRLARRRTSSQSDAHDVVAEAIARALAAPDLRPAQIPAWLNRVTVNLCVDLGRDQARAPKRIRYQLLQGRVEPAFDDQVVDRLAAAGVGLLVAELPSAQRQALQLRADGRSLAEVAQTMQFSHKAAESLLSRARATLRLMLRGSVIALAAVFMRAVRRPVQTLAPGALALVALAPLLLQTAPYRGDTSPTAPTTIPVTQTADGGLAQARTRGLSTSGATALRTRARSEPVPASAGGRLVPSRELRAGPVVARDAGAGRTQADESLLQSVGRCVSEGVVVSTEYVGCRSAQPPR